MASLCDALEEIGDRAIADHISKLLLSLFVYYSLLCKNSTESPFGMKSYKEIVTTNKGNYLAAYWLFIVHNLSFL